MDEYIPSEPYENTTCICGASDMSECICYDYDDSYERTYEEMEA